MVGYKVGALFGGGLLAWLSAYCSWEWLFTLWGTFYIVMLIISLININNGSCSQYARRKEVPCRNHTTNGHHSHSTTSVSNDHNTSGKLSSMQIVKTILKTADFSWLICCVVTYKLGKQGVVSMLPLFLIDQRIPQEQVGVISGIFGQVFSIAGSTIGGWIVGWNYGQR